MLEKCVWGKQLNTYKYFLADGSGTAIGSNCFHVDLPNGSKETLPWTLSNYLKVSVQYPSRLRIYCVRQLICPGIVTAVILCQLSHWSCICSRSVEPH